MPFEPTPPSEQQRALQAIALGALLGALIALLARRSRSAR
jgi:hypothetical protein